MTNQPMRVRPDGLTIISIWFYLCGVFFLFVTACLAFLTLTFGINAFSDNMRLLMPAGMFALIALAFMALSILNLVVGYGLWILKPWARIGAIALSMVGLIFMPIGTISGALTLWYLLMPTAAAAFENPASQA